MEHYSIVWNQVYSDYLFHVETATTNRHQSPSSASPQFHINFKFSCNALFSDWVLPQDSTELHLLAAAQRPRMETLILVNLQQFLCYKKAHEIIREELIHWPVWGEAHGKLIQFALKKAREAVLTMPASHNVVNLHIRVAAVHKHVFEESIDWVVQHSMDVDEVRMVPADDSSIEALDSNKALILTDSGTCSVCLEEFFKGCEVVCMPCAHIFHEDCIKKWLRTSHYCPVCRFEMPMR